MVGLGDVVSPTGMHLAGKLLIENRMLTLWQALDLQTLNCLFMSSTRTIWIKCSILPFTYDLLPYFQGQLTGIQASIHRHSFAFYTPDAVEITKELYPHQVDCMPSFNRLRNLL